MRVAMQATGVQAMAGVPGVARGVVAGWASLPDA